MTRQDRGAVAFLAILLTLVCALGIAGRNHQTEASPEVHARYDDGTPLGGSGLHLLVERLGYSVQCLNAPLQSMPTDAAVWFILDPDTRFSSREANALLHWISQGGTLIWALPSYSLSLGTLDKMLSPSAGMVKLRSTLGLSKDAIPTPSVPYELLPPLKPFNRSSIDSYWTGVSSAQGSDALLDMQGHYLELAGTPAGPQLARVNYGRGRVILAADALAFTNYALNHPDNAVLITNFVRFQSPPGRNTVYFDERSSGDDIETPVTPNLLYYLWQPPLRYAVLQLLFAALLLWGFYGRRLGSPVPLPEGDPVTRAGQYALAMGSLFEKARRPGVAARIVGEDFRKRLARRLGMSVEDRATDLAARAAMLCQLPEEMIDRLLLASGAPAENEQQMLTDAQEMELVLREIEPTVNEYSSGTPESADAPATLPTAPGAISSHSAAAEVRAGATLAVLQMAQAIRAEVAKAVVGQDEVVTQFLIALLVRGHVLLEGVPGVANTLTAKALSHALSASFKRIQFTPDLMPSDVVGTNVFDMATQRFSLRQGPVFTDILLADEINRTPPKTQAALLEAMQERQVTIDGEKHTLPPLFTVFATQNPIDYEGTYPLPEAQLDRFLMKVEMGYPSPDEEVALLNRVHRGFDAHELASAGLSAVVCSAELAAARAAVRAVTVSEGMLRYVCQVVGPTRGLPTLTLGASPRASIALLECAKALAAINGRDFMIPEDVKTVATPVLRHRLLLRAEAEMEGTKTDDVVRSVLGAVEVPR